MWSTVPLGAPWLGDFVEELAGATKHDDAQDACSYGLFDPHGVRDLGAEVPSS